MPQIIQPYINPSILEKHASRHSFGGADPLTPVMIGLESIDTLPVTMGGTGATTAAGACMTLGAAAANHNHDTAYSAVEHEHIEKLTASFNATTGILTIGTKQYNLSTLEVTP